MWNRKRKQQGLEAIAYRPNFRIDVAKSKPYKGQRKQEKPFHRDNIRAYMLDNYDVRIANGMEADDMLAITQTKAEPLTTVICSRDKDLKMVEGMHFTWPCGKQQQWGPAPVSKLGELQYDEGKNKLTGTGSKFFYSQLITGDTVDNIPGLPRGGPALAYKLLKDCKHEEQLFKVVAEKYIDKIGDSWLDYFMEQSGLLWMVSSLDEDGEPIMYLPNQEWIDDITREI